MKFPPKIHLYYKLEPEKDRWFPGDRFIRPTVRRIARGKPLVGGVDKVFYNLRLGLEKIGIPFIINTPFESINNGDFVACLGRGKQCLDGYKKANPIVAGIGLMTHPSEWPNLCNDLPVAKYLQHSKWANDTYIPYYGDRCTIWPVGIDTSHWQNHSHSSPSVDFLIYDKIRWDYSSRKSEILDPIFNILSEKKMSFQYIKYGKYKPEGYKKLLNHCRGMIFLCEHESQGLAYQECLASDVPIIAWDQGECLDPNRFAWGSPYIPATSVPYWDERCGVKFKNIYEFPEKLNQFIESRNEGKFRPREFVLENLTLEKSARNFIRVLQDL